MKATGTEMPAAARKGADRFGEVIAEYKRMQGVEGDVLQPGAFDLYSGLLSDGFHWAKLLGIDFTLAFIEAYKDFLREETK